MVKFPLRVKSADFVLSSFFFSCATLFTIWFVLSTISYKKIFPAEVSDFSLRRNAKELQAFLLIVGWSFPFIVPWISAQYKRLLSKKWSEIIFFVALFSFDLFYFGWINILGWFGALSFYVFVGPQIQTPIFEKIGKIVFFIFSIVLAFLFAQKMGHRSSLVFDLYDHGPRLAAVGEYLLGGVPYRDIFIHYGPLQDIVRPLIAFKMWGVSYASDLRMGPWLCAIGAVALWGILIAIVRRKFIACLMGLIILWRNDLFISDRIFLSLMGIVPFCWGLKYLNLDSPPQKTIRVLFGVSGFTTIASFLYSFEIGLMTAAGVAVYFFLIFVFSRKDFKNILFPWAGGMLLGGGIFLSYLLVNNAAVGFYSNNYHLLVDRLPTWSDGLSSHLFTFNFLNSRILFDTYLYLHSIPFIVFGVLCYFLRPRNRNALASTGHQALLIASILFFHFFIYISRSDFQHWKNASILLIPLLGLILDETLNWIQHPDSVGLSTRRKTILLMGLLSLPLISAAQGPATFWAFIFNGRDSFKSVSKVSFQQFSDRLGEVGLSNEKREEVNRVIAQIKETVSEDGTYFDFSNYGGYYFLTARRNATRYGLVNYIHGPRMVMDCLEQLKTKKPQAVLAEEGQNGFVFRSDLQEIADYITLNFKPKYKIGRLVILVPSVNAS